MKKDDISASGLFYPETGSLNPPSSTEQDRFNSLFNILRDREEFTLNTEGIIMSSNLEAVSITGYEEWEVIGRPVTLFYSPEDIANKNPETDLQRAVEAGRIHLAGWRVKKKNKNFWAKVKIQALFGEAGEHTGFKMTIRDASHKVMYNYRVKNIRNEYLSLFNNSFIGIFKFRFDDSQVLIMNEKAIEIFDCDSAETVYFNQLFNSSRDYSRLKEILQKGERVEGFEFELSKNGIKNNWVSISCRHFEEGDFVEGIVLDVTENRKQVIELQRLNHELDQLIYHSSHDLRSPLTTIMGLVNLIRLDQPSPTIRDYTEMIGERVNHLDVLLKDLVSITYHNKTEVESEIFHFEEEIQALLGEFMASSPGINVFLNAPPALEFYTDPIRLRTVLKNLLSNAFKFYNPTVSNPFVKIDLSVSSGYIIIAIEDNGIGIPVAYQNNIFEMFYKAASTNGTGLGLYIVRLLLGAMGGKIELDSTEGTGSTFTIFLPNQISRSTDTI